MKFREIVIISITVVLVYSIATLYKYIAHAPEKMLQALLWVLLGTIVGMISTTLWLWRKKKLSFTNVMGLTSMFSLMSFGGGFIDLQNTQEPGLFLGIGILLILSGCAGLYEAARKIQ